ncbi:MAG: cell division protein ZapA [Rhizobiales bacterium 35-68-8]|nr:MAG: cell division protein ZapA [Rhizobiales bacterium 35-68-8]
MACDEGQEEHLVRLARDVDARIAQLRTAFGEIGDQRLTVMAAVTIADELSEARARIRALESDLDGQRDARASALARIEASEEVVARTIDEAAERLEKLAREIAPPAPRAIGMG